MSRDPWEMLTAHWSASLRATDDRSPETIKVYKAAVANLREWAGARGFDDPRDLTHRDLVEYFADFRDRKNKNTGKPLSPSYVRKDYASLRQFFKWLAAENETRVDLMAGLKIARPKVKPVDVFTVDDLRALLKACATLPDYVANPGLAGRDFVARRDAAMIWTLADCGVRRGELMTMTVDGVDLENGTARVVGKTGERLVPFGPKTGEALARYLRARAGHKDAGLDALWLATSPHRGAMGIDGLRQMINRRAIDAGVPGRVHPHRFRHTAYDAYAKAGLSDTDAMKVFGWTTRAMLDVYGKSNAQNRAIAAAHALKPSSRI